MNLYNKKGIFSNAADTVEDLDAELRKRFREVEVGVAGTVALFEVRDFLRGMGRSAHDSHRHEDHGSKSQQGDPIRSKP